MTTSDLGVATASSKSCSPSNQKNTNPYKSLEPVIGPCQTGIVTLGVPVKYCEMFQPIPQILQRRNLTGS
jgi:hypothetical protein